MQATTSRIQSDQVQVGLSHHHDIRSRHSPAIPKFRPKVRFTCSNPAVCTKSRLVDRILSFQSWPNPHLASPKTFSEAGFFYLGAADKVKCYNCGGGLGGWRPNEDPYYEHAKWFPECEYIQQCKGLDYVAEVVRRHPNLNRPATHNPIPLPANHLPQIEVVSDERINSTAMSAQGRSLDERIEEAMKSEVVAAALILAFDSEVVRKLVGEKLKNNGEEYTSVMTLVGDLQNEDNDESSEELMESQPTTSYQSRPSSSSLTSSPASSASSSRSASHDPEIVSDGFSQDISSVPAGQVLMNNFSPVDIPPPSPATPSPPPSPVDYSSSGIYDDEVNRDDDEMIHEDDRCKVCLDRKSDCVFMPCNHLCCCTSCASALKSCPVCRTKLKSILKIYRR